MSMPAFPEPDKILTREEAVNSILTSIALEEAALSHIINAEGEKIQYALKQLKVGENSGLHAVLAVNESVAMMLGQITDIQLVLVNKLEKVLKRIPPCPAPPCATPPRTDSYCPEKPGTVKVSQAFLPQRCV
jgi:hypothetical protein